MKTFLISGLLCFLSSALARAEGAHDIHVCISEIRWNRESASFEVSIKIFIDDLEKALAADHKAGLHIGTPKESPDAEKAITDYLEQHFHITLDDIRLPPEFVGKETTEDYQAIWCYIEYPGIKSPKSCTISNDILFDFYSDQRNIMDIRMSETQKAYTIFEPGRSSWSYTF